MITPKQINFKLLNKLSENDINNSEYIIYAHKCPAGVYVGMSKDPVERWKQHTETAFDKNNIRYDEVFKKAIRQYQCNFDHFIVAVANSEKIARKKEAAAIEYYKANLNTKSEPLDIAMDIRFQSLDTLIYNKMMLKRRSARTGANNSEKDRVFIQAKIVLDGGRKRVVSIEGQAFPAGLYVNCDYEERDRFDVGDYVKVAVLMSESEAKGKYLVAGKNALLTKVNKR